MEETIDSSSSSTRLSADDTLNSSIRPKDVQNGTTALSKITSTVYFLQPGDKLSNDSPSAIIIFGWMGSPVRHMAKFVDYYSKTMFPGSPIILILTPPKYFITNEEQQKLSMKPAYTAFQSLNVGPDNVLVHVFSNGGLYAFRTFVSLTPTKSFTPRELVVDSAPGIATLRTTIIAFTVDVQNFFTRFILSIVLVVAYFTSRMRDRLLGRQSVWQILRKWLADENVVGKRAKRVYLYSDKDELVQNSSVEAHIKELKGKGYTLTSRNLGETRHVGHMRANPELYWSEILRAWKESSPGRV